MRWARPRAALSTRSHALIDRGEPIYERLKARLLDSTGSSELQIGILAGELGTSNTPVREALVRLAAERLIAYVPKRGFLAKTVSQAELRGLYIVSQTMLQAAFNTHRKPGEGAPVTSGQHAHASQADDAVTLAQCAADLFLQIARQSGVDEFAAIVRNVNDRLHQPRIAEYALIENPQTEVLSMETAFVAGRYEELKQSISEYHELRLRLLAPIHRELILMRLSGG